MKIVGANKKSGYIWLISYLALLTGDGITLASSNRNDPDSFVGKSYQFRPYFTQAIKGAQGRYFALEATSLKRGFYASYPVRDDKDVIVGVAVIKYNIDMRHYHSASDNPLQDIEIGRTGACKRNSLSRAV